MSREIDLDPETASAIKERGGTWAIYRNELLDSTSLGHIQCLRFGEGCTYEEPPACMPDTPYGSGWKYRLVGRVRAQDVPDHGRMRVNGDWCEARDDSSEGLL